MNILKIKKLIEDLIRDSFINRVLLLINQLYEESFISKTQNSLRKLYYDSFIFRVFKKCDDEIKIKFKFIKINYDGNYKNFIIFVIILSIPFILTIPSNLIKIIILTLLYFLFLIVLIKEELIFDSFLFKIFGENDD